MIQPRTLLQLVPVDIPVEDGMVHGTDCVHAAERYWWGLDMKGELYLVYRHDWPSLSANRPRLSVRDSHWSPWHGLRYIEWIT